MYIGGKCKQKDEPAKRLLGLSRAVAKVVAAVRATVTAVGTSSQVCDVRPCEDLEGKITWS